MSVSSETVYWQRGVQVKVVAVSILAGFVRSSNYLYLAEKDECKTSLDSSRAKKRSFRELLSLVMRLLQVGKHTDNLAPTTL